MSKPSLWKRLSSVCALCAVAAIASPAQTFTSLVSFNVTDGALPYYGPLAQGFDGNLYGTTASGQLNCFYDKGRTGCGTAFKITTAGALTTIYNFSSAQWEPEAGLVLGTDGSFYGTTCLGGDLSQSQCIDDLGNDVGCGTVFKITSQGKLTSLHNFEYTDGANPASELVQATNGNFYGTANNGGANFYGTIFEITPSGNLTSLHSFDFNDGAFPSALVEDSNGNFYGTTTSGGA
ncbi:MAG TPA: choice-of-anchor tandem repeat GloVer-containing protein [Terriglobia bacterium]|nr:choice-of-anchor tandem repeat GloVer-containing protein [Terriglobia bacterium]